VTRVTFQNSHSLGIESAVVLQGLRPSGLRLFKSDGQVSRY